MIRNVRWRLVVLVVVIGGTLCGMVGARRAAAAENVIKGAAKVTKSKSGGVEFINVDVSSGKKGKKGRRKNKNKRRSRKTNRKKKGGGAKAKKKPKAAEKPKAPVIRDAEVKFKRSEADKPSEPPGTFRLGRMGVIDIDGKVLPTVDLWRGSVKIVAVLGSLDSQDNWVVDQKLRARVKAFREGVLVRISTSTMKGKLTLLTLKAVNPDDDPDAKKPAAAPVDNAATPPEAAGSP